MAKYIVNWDKYAKIARKAAAEGAVLLRNENKALPIRRGEKVSVFGRIQLDYYKSGTGSGGKVHTRYVTSILDGLKNYPAIQLNENLLHIYEAWCKEHPFDLGMGWAAEPWCQEEMPLTEEMVKEAADTSNVAIIVIGRSAGEDKDNAAEEGSYLLTALEEDMIAKVCGQFDRVAIVLNVGNIIDMKWVEKYQPQAVVYTWQGGMEGGNAVADILTGAVNPSGKLTDTIAWDITDYPSTEGFGDPSEVVYKEDIYVGYRYFETFAKDKVLYPFGFGLSYTTFKIRAKLLAEKDDGMEIKVSVTNTGTLEGREVVQVYVTKPQGKLGQPVKELVGYKKTSLLAPDETEKLIIPVKKYMLASYDDSGVTGFPYAYVLEAGEYEITVGNSVRDEAAHLFFEVKETKKIVQCKQALAPVKEFDRMRSLDGKLTFEKAPLRAYDLKERMKKKRPECKAYTGDQGIRLSMVYDKQASLEDFLAQIEDKQLSYMMKGEGMCSPKVTPGTAAAYGGVTDELVTFGIPTMCCSDGPSGIRMDCGTKAFSLPNGTCLACTFDTKLNERLYRMEGLELRKNQIDSLLGPGMNIHRNPLNGRNFEYFSEDPYLTGTIGAAQLKGLHKWGVTGTIKHFATNNQEFKRRQLNAVVSERALREIYLKGFEIAVKEGKALSIMTTYGALNGIWTAGNYDLLTTILRKEWKFKGMVMTDWWADVNEEGGEQSITNLYPMVRAQNDTFMVTGNAVENEDNILEGLEQGLITRAELVRNAANICRTAMKLHSMDRFLDRVDDEEKEDIASQAKEDEMNFELEFQNMDENPNLDVANLDTSAGASALFGLETRHGAEYRLKMKMRAKGGAVAQVPVTVSLDGSILFTETLKGNEEWVEKIHEPVISFGKNHYLKLFFGEGGMEIAEITLEFVKEVEMSL